MQMDIEIVSVEGPYKKGDYPRLDVEYIRDGNEKKTTLTAVAKTKDVVNVLRNAEPGEFYTIELEKNGKYYNWVGAAKSDGDEQVSGKASSGPKKSSFGGKAGGNWETAEERARRQIYIIRQSSLSLAGSQLGAGAGFDSLVSLAEKLTQYVLNGPQEEVEAEEAPVKKKSSAKKTESDDFDDDIPF